MAQRLKATLPLTIVIGVLAFGWTEFVLNFTFHWFTVKDGVFGKFGLPEHFYLICLRRLRAGACTSCSEPIGARCTRR